MVRPTPSPDDMEDLLLSCRYGDLDDVKSFIDRFGTTPVGEARDENGNNVLHMASANGHVELLDVLLPIVPSSLLSTSNRAGSTALHWAVLNAQLSAARRLVEFPGGPGIDLIDIKNAAGHSPLAEAEAAGWDEGAKWIVEMMRLVDAGGVGPVAEEEEETADSEIENQGEEETEGGATRTSVEGPGVGGRPPSSS